MKNKQYILFVSLLSVAIVFCLFYPQMFAMKEPRHLVFEGQSDSWKAVVEVHQSKRNFYQYVVSERHELKYIAEPIEGGIRERPVEWNIDSVLSSSDSTNRVSHFSETIGTAKHGTTMETNASHQVADIDDEFEVEIVWNESMSEHIKLTCVSWE